MIQANTRSEGVHASSAPTIIACAVVMIATCCSRSLDRRFRHTTAELFLACDRGLRTFVEPFPIGLVSFPLTFVGRAAAGRAKLLEVPAEADQPERTIAIWIPATICHGVASAFVRRIQRVNCSWPIPRQKRPQYRSPAGFRRQIILGSALSQWEQRGSVRMATSFWGTAILDPGVLCYLAVEISEGDDAPVSVRPPPCSTVQMFRRLIPTYVLAGPGG
jgi:hypothetical protein